MIVAPIVDGDQLVLQSDHDDLSGAFAAAWGGPGFWSPSPRESVVLACADHDDGWEEWERAPQIDPGSGRPLHFLDVDVPTHLRLYRAGIARVSAQDPYAGTLVSMHGAGIYKQRYGTQPALGMRRRTPETEDAVQAFVREQEDWRAQQIAALGIDPDELWSAYRLLQLADRFSLFVAFAPDANRALELESAPGAGGEDRRLRFERLSAWRVRIDPYPLREPEARFELVRRVLPSRSWSSEGEFLDAFHATEPETVAIEVTA